MAEADDPPVYDDTDSFDSSSSSVTTDTYSPLSSDGEEEGGAEERYYVTKESQEEVSDATRKGSYVGMRDLTDLEKIQEQDIVATDGSVRGVKNRVRAGLANFENRKALDKKRKEDGRIIVYVTSFRGVRRTYEDCRYVTTVLHNFRVNIEEKDVYINKSFYKELNDRLGEDRRSRSSLPQVFVNGQHIGGKSEIEELNETGELRRLLESFGRKEAPKKCAYCGGYEFIPCRKCNGTKDSVKNTFTNEFKALRCTHCNENGLEPCPACKEGTDGGDMWNEEELKRWKEREEQEKKDEDERRKMDKRNRIKKEALEAEFQEKLKTERESAERVRMREERKKKRAKEAAVITRVVDDIEKNLEKERQWREERKSLVLDTDSSG